MSFDDNHRNQDRERGAYTPPTDDDDLPFFLDHHTDGLPASGPVSMDAPSVGHRLAPIISPNRRPHKG